MINTKGIIQNNKTASDFIRKQRKFNKVYKILSKEEERAMVERYARIKLDENGNPIYRTEPSAPGLHDDFECEFEWIGDETELRLKLVMHNLQAVTRISSKHCQDTRDYDDMYAKGLYGLTRAANEFHPFKLITKTVGTKEVDGKKVPVKEVVLDKDGKPDFIKFNTFAQFWIFKYVMDEFYAKSIPIDNNSVSLNELVKMHGDTAKNFTLENYIQDNLSPEVSPQKTVSDEVSSAEASSLYESIHNYIKTTNDISSLEKRILEETFYGNDEYIKKDGTANIKKLSTLLKIPQQSVIESQTSAFMKLKDYLYEEYGISSLSDIF
jgi:DNA-directed RNA polymerase specialized sigma subunit